MYKLLSFMGENPRSVRKYLSNDHLTWIDIPFDPLNTDYQDYLNWVSLGNIPEPA